jgi:hypothetical protein
VIVLDLTPYELRQRLANRGLRVRVGLFVYSIRSPLPEIEAGIGLHYPWHTLEDDDAFVDFHVKVDRSKGLRRWLRPQVHFRFDGNPPFNPLPGNQAFPLLEWGLNWCVSAHAHRWIILHSAVLERDGRCLLLPAPSGAGKSTLTAALMLRGWRLFSDELALIDPGSGRLQPLPRPVSLKNQSIEIIRSFDSGAVIGKVVPDTLKGSVAHVRPMREHVMQHMVDARPGWIVVPEYLPGAPARLEPLSKAQALMLLAKNAFNYNIHGRAGFRALADVVDRSQCLAFSYSQLDDAVAVFERLARPAPGERVHGDIPGPSATCQDRQQADMLRAATS